jgi:hypothetical protein
MKNGFKVFDTDTHVLPAAEDRAPMRQSAEYQGALHGYRVPNHGIPVSRCGIAARR